MVSFGYERYIWGQRLSLATIYKYALYIYSQIDGG